MTGPTTVYFLMHKSSWAWTEFADTQTWMTKWHWFALAPWILNWTHQAAEFTWTYLNHLEPNPKDSLKHIETLEPFKISQALGYISVYFCAPLWRSLGTLKDCADYISSTSGGEVAERLTWVATKDLEDFKMLQADFKWFRVVHPCIAKACKSCASLGPNYLRLPPSLFFVCMFTIYQ